MPLCTAIANWRVIIGAGKKGTRERGKQKENQRCGQRLCSVLRKKLYVFDPDAEALLIAAGEAVLNGKIENIAVNVFGVKITISLSAKGKLKFKRSYKESAVVEVM